MGPNVVLCVLLKPLQTQEHSQQAVQEAALYAPAPAHAAAQLQPTHALRLRRPARLASSYYGLRVYSRCTRQTDRRQTSDSIIA